MINKNFEEYKLKRELKRNGISYKFSRAKKIKFGELTDEVFQVGVVCGIYHETNSHISVTTGDTTQTRTKKIPAILCLYKEVISTALKVGDIVIINDKTMKITGIVNVQEWNIAADISLEVIDDGYSI